MASRAIADRVRINILEALEADLECAGSCKEPTEYLAEYTKQLKRIGKFLGYQVNPPAQEEEKP